MIRDYSPYFYGISNKGEWITPKSKTASHPKIVNGDIVEIIYDQYNRKILLSINYKFLGTILKDLPNGKCIPCIRGSYYGDVDIINVLGTSDPPVTYLT